MNEYLCWWLLHPRYEKTSYASVLSGLLSVLIVNATSAITNEVDTRKAARKLHDEKCIDTGNGKIFATEQGKQQYGHLFLYLERQIPLNTLSIENPAPAIEENSSRESPALTQSKPAGPRYMVKQALRGALV